VRRGDRQNGMGRSGIDHVAAVLGPLACGSRSARPLSPF